MLSPAEKSRHSSSEKTIEFGGNKLDAKRKLLHLFFTVLVLMAALSEPTKAVEPTEDDQITCYGPCIFLPLLHSIWQDLTRLEEPIDVPELASETLSTQASAIDLVSNPGHPRVWFGTSEQQISDTLCDVPIAGQDPTLFEGLANVRFDYGSGDPEFTFIPDTEQLPEIDPVAGWRYRPSANDVALLAESLRSEGLNAQAAAVEKLVGKLVFVAQLNRGAIIGLGLDTDLEAFSKYRLVCHQ